MCSEGNCKGDCKMEARGGALNDGYKSRKFWASVGGFILVEGIASSALFSGILESSQWVSLTQWLFPLVLAIFSGASVTEKVLGKKGK